MNNDFETHERGTAHELKMLREIAELVGAMLRSDPKFSLKDLCDKHQLLLSYYKRQLDYVPCKEL